ncbi:DUF7344 domain-containing protein [Halorientalis pallida]|uniref:DUF7344 domain-containing protein n=1 Tax=Halorientalis pallida TaxID=2479928 RepID=UPI00187D2569|nr:helix-turn-helix domain-containing protein [Halorientalis pallida]
MFAALADPQRRRLLRHLRAAGGPVTTSELARTLAPNTRGRDDGIQRALSALVHVHLPKLNAVGLVHWDGRRAELADLRTLPMAVPLDDLLANPDPDRGARP